MGSSEDTVRTRWGDTLSALKQREKERERGEEGREGDKSIDEDEGGQNEGGQNAGSAAYNAGRRSQSGRNAITLTRNPITYSFA